MNFALIEIESQEELDYELPLRVLDYDLAEYKKQVSKTCREIRRNAKGLNAGAYMRGF